MIKELILISILATNRKDNQMKTIAKISKNKSKYFTGKLYVHKHERSKNNPVVFSVDIYPQKRMIDVMTIGNSILFKLELKIEQWEK